VKHRVAILARGRKRLPVESIEAAVNALLDAEDQPPSEIAVVIAGISEIRSLNSQYRGIDEPTDVLSFPAGEGPEPGDLPSLGDIAICLPVAEAQAAANSTSLETELACLAVHGALHLLDYEDETDDGRALMVEKMNLIVASVGLNPQADWFSAHYAKAR
jgi:rRNA maturation RNase YbeY